MSEQPNEPLSLPAGNAERVDVHHPVGKTMPATSFPPGADPLPAITEDDLTHLARVDPGERVRVLIERAIVRKTTEMLLARGYKLAVHDGEGFATGVVDNVQAVMAAVMATDSDVLHVYGRSSEEAGEWTVVGSVLFVYGESGWDVIGDHSTNLDDDLAPVVAYAELLSVWC